MNAASYYKHIRSLAPFRAIEAFALAKEAAELDAKSRKPNAPTLVCWEDGEIRLSFSIKVF